MVVFTYLRCPKWDIWNTRPGLLRERGFVITL